ncbi:hypothetical protein MBLNU13_g00866t1 [Cladosporium sp. NU13]
MSAFESAIDDSFDPIPQPPPDEEYTDDSFFDNAYQGPREGHWDVTSSVGSFIDDRSPTVYGYHNKPYATGRGLNIDEGLAKRLMQATAEEKRTAVIAGAKSPATADQLSDWVRRSFATSEAKASKPFFVPPVRNRLYNPLVPDLPAVADNAPTPPAAASTRSRRKPSSNSKASSSAGPHTAPPTAVQTNATSNSPVPSPSTGRTIKILGKNGEVAFVDLPSLPKTYPQASSSVKDSATDQPAKRFEVPLNHDKQSHSSHLNFGIDKKETGMIPETRTTASKEQTPSPDGGWAAALPASERSQPHKSGSAIMSGALPMPSPWASPAPQSVAASCKDSGVVMGDVSAVASNASSAKTASTKPGSAISQRVFSVAQNIAKMASNASAKSSSVQAAPLPPPFDEVGMGVTTGFPAQKAQSGRGNWMTRHTGFGSVRVSQRSAKNDAPSERSVRKRSEQGTARSNYKPPSVRSVSRSTSTSYLGFGSERPSNHPAGSHAPSSRTSHERSQPDSSHLSYKPPTVRSISRPDHASYSGSGSEKATQGCVGNDATSANSAHKHRKEEKEARSTYKPPTVRSSRSSSSVSHAFGGFQHGGIAQQADIHSVRLEDKQSSTHSRCAQPEAAEGNGYASTSSRARAALSIARPELRVDTHVPVSPLSDGTSPICPSHSPVSPLAQSPHVLHTTNQQTRFAGDGWISPHPLSVATSEIGVPPQSAVYISADGPGHVGTLTYSQWRAHRDAANTASGSFTGSRVPSALEPHIAPEEVYNYPPPASFVGSYELQTRQLHQLRSQADPDIDRRDQHERWTPECRVSNHTAFSQEQRRSYNDQGSVRDHSQSLRSSHNTSVYGDSASDSGHNAPVLGYNVGLTPTELANYHRQLSNTISHHSSRLSHVEEEQGSPQPEYDVWNSSHSRASRRAISHHSAISRHSAQAFPPNLSYPREKTQIEMPWDHASSDTSSSGSSSRHARSQRRSSAHKGSQITTLARSHVSDNGSRVSAMSHTRSNVPQSQATYGTEGWQDLENAEDGRGRFQSRYDWR